MTNPADIRKLACLDDWQLVDPDQDLRGKTLIALDGRDVGRVDDMLADLAEARIVALRLEDDRIINIDHVDIRDGQPVLTVDPMRIPRPPRDFDRQSIGYEQVLIVAAAPEAGRRQSDLGNLRVRAQIADADRDGPGQADDADPLRRQE